MLSLLVDAAAAHVDDRHMNLSEARLAIDAANALLAAVGRALPNDERLAIEGLLTQLQVEYVKRSGV